MRTKAALLVLLPALALAAAGLSLRPSGVAAQDGTSTLYVSGLRINEPRTRALVRVTNVSRNGGDVYFLHYTVRDPAAGAFVSQPGAGPVGAELLPGHTLELDLGEIVAQWRASLGVGPYGGPVQLVAFGRGGVEHPFGPATVHVEAIQTEGAATFPAIVHWRPGP